MFLKAQPGSGPQCHVFWHAFEHCLQRKTRLWLNETEKNKKIYG